MNCASCDMCVYHLRFVLCFSLGVFLSSRVTGSLSCDHGRDYAS